jgi:hypothetical protein
MKSCHHQCTLSKIILTIIGRFKRLENRPATAFGLKKGLITVLRYTNGVASYVVPPLALQGIIDTTF